MTEYLAANGCDQLRVAFADYGLGVSLLTEGTDEEGVDEDADDESQGDAEDQS